jgi:hypothetical protein
VAYEMLICWEIDVCNALVVTFFEGPSVLTTIQQALKTMRAICSALSTIFAQSLAIL